MLTPDAVERVFRDAGALLDGHFVLSSGRHSARYLEKFRVFEHPRLTERLSAGILERVRDSRIDVVVGPTTGGVILAHEVARQLGARAAFAERSDGRPGREFRRDQVRPRSDDRVLVVDDILTTGGSLNETLHAVAGTGATIVAVAVLVDRSGGTDFAGVPLHALWTMTIETFDPATCPLCARGMPATRPGTTPAAATASSGGERGA